MMATNIEGTKSIDRTTTPSGSAEGMSRTPGPSFEPAVSSRSSHPSILSSIKKRFSSSKKMKDATSPSTSPSAAPSAVDGGDPNPEVHTSPTQDDVHSKVGMQPSSSPDEEEMVGLMLTTTDQVVAKILFECGISHSQVLKIVKKGRIHSIKKVLNVDK